MELIPHGMELHAPNMCVICELTPQVAVVDTLREMTVGGANGTILAHHLSGRKYVCVDCARQIAQATGTVVDADELTEALNECAVLNQQLKATRAANASLSAEAASLREARNEHFVRAEAVIDRVRDLLDAPRPAPSTTTRARAAKA